MSPDQTFLEAIWAALGDDPSRLAQVAPMLLPDLPSVLPVAELVSDSIAAASLAAAGLTGSSPTVRLDPNRVGTAVTSERHFRWGGESPDVWAELSGFWPTGDGWVRAHANYPHHRARLLTAVGLPADSGRAEFEARLSELGAREIEEAAASVGAVAVRVRTEAEWRAEPQAQSVAESPLIAIEAVDEGVHAWSARSLEAPLAGIRILDLTRVIAGPVTTRTLAYFGADVLRVDSPHLTEPEWQHLDTGAGKRSTLLDLRDRRDRARFDELLAGADVLVTGYRPGALAELGLGADVLRVANPALVVGTVSAWGTSGPWAGRRGFDSIVQAATGIALAATKADGSPGALPAQGLDHASGYLLAAGIMSTIGRGRGAALEVSLARTALDLQSRAPQRLSEPVEVEPTTTRVVTPVGELTYTLPAVGYEGAPADWPAPSRPWGRDRAEWRA